MKKTKFSYSKSKIKLSRNLTLIMSVIIILIALIFHDESPSDAQTFVELAENKPNIENQNSELNLASINPLEQDQSYVIIDPIKNQVLKSYNADKKRAPASTLKLITGLITLKTLKGTDIVQVGQEVNNIEGSKLGLKPGDKISVHNLLKALYVNSSNDAAAALAMKISGSIPAFAQKMNEYAATLGCQNSNFTNPHGLPDSNQYTTANDLSKIAREFIQNEELMKIVKETSAYVQWEDLQGVLHEAEVKNTNRLLKIYPGDLGLKTGTTTEAGQCLVSYVTRPDRDLLLVLLGSKQRYADTIKLLDEAWAEQRTEAALQGLTKDPRSLILSPGLF